MTSINDFATTYMCQALPFGGVKDSGFDRFAGVEGLRGLCVAKAVCEDRCGRARMDCEHSQSGAGLIAIRLDTLRALALGRPPQAMSMAVPVSQEGRGALARGTDRAWAGWRALQRVSGHAPAGSRRLWRARALCPERSQARRRWPWLMRTDIPPILRYPVGNGAFGFVAGLVAMFYGTSLAARARGLSAVLGALLRGAPARPKQ
jgi:hypothetical protein